MFRESALETIVSKLFAWFFFRVRFTNLTHVPEFVSCSAMTLSPPLLLPLFSLLFTVGSAYCTVFLHACGRLSPTRSSDNDARSRRSQGVDVTVPQNDVSESSEQVSLQRLGKKISQHLKCWTMSDRNLVRLCPVLDPKIPNVDMT